MARPRKFDENVARDAAMMTFWLHGYDGASYDRLVEATGASRKGLYSIWSDKEELFVDCLKLYRNTVAKEFFGHLRRDDLTAEQFDEVWSIVGSAPYRGVDVTGCLICQAALHGAQFSKRVEEITKEHFGDTAGAFAAALRTLWARDGAPPGADADERGIEAAALCTSILVTSNGPFTTAVAHMREMGRRTRM